MTIDHETQSTAEALDEELIAYLDGELDDAHARQVERRLADDASYRARLTRLQQVWDILDTLGRTEADESFTHSTMAMVAVRTEGEVDAKVQAARRQRVWGWAAVAAAAVLIMGTAFALGRRALNRENDALVRDLAVIERVDPYRNIDSIAFLQRLQQAGLFAGDVETSLASSDKPLLVPSPETNFAASAELLAKLSLEEKEELLRKKERFDALAPASGAAGQPDEQQRLRKLHAELAAAPDAQELDRILFRYSDWLKGLTSAQKGEVQDFEQPMDKRIARIADIVHFQQSQRFREYLRESFPTQSEDLEKISAWLNKFVEKHEDDIIDALDDNDQRRIRRMDDEQHRRRALVMRLGGAWGNRRMPFPKDDELLELVATLSDETRSELEKATDTKDRVSRARELIGAAVFTISFPPPSEDELLKFYAELPADKREFLDRLDSDQMQRQLRHMYRMAKFGERGNPWGGGRGGRGGDGGPGRGPDRGGPDRGGPDRGGPSRDGPGRPPGPPPGEFPPPTPE
jgi:hypothetical protein